MIPFGFVYQTENLYNGKKYIGKCIYSRQNDWQKYLGSGVDLLKDIRHYGRENFERIILAEAYSREELNQLEEYYISHYNAATSPEFYNIKVSAVGGDIFSFNPRKELIREKRKKQMSGEGNHQFGKPKTDRMIESVKVANSKAIQIEGHVYPSVTEASKALKINTTTICYRLNSKSARFHDYIYL